MDEELTFLPRDHIITRLLVLSLLLSNLWMNFLWRYHSNERRTLVLLVFFKKEKTFFEILLWLLLGIKG